MFYRPLVLKLIELFQYLLKYSTQNNLNNVFLSVLFESIFLKSINNNNTNNNLMNNNSNKSNNIAINDINSYEMYQSSKNSIIFSFILNESINILDSIKQEISNYTQNLTIKCQRIRVLQENISKGFQISIINNNINNINNINNENEIILLKKLFYSLKYLELIILNNNESNLSLETQNKSNNHSINNTLNTNVNGNFNGNLIQNSNEMINELTINEILANKRWEICGFNPLNPTESFANNGLLGMISLTNFLET